MRRVLALLVVCFGCGSKVVVPSDGSTGDVGSTASMGATTSAPLDTGPPATTLPTGSTADETTAAGTTDGGTTDVGAGTTSAASTGFDSSSTGSSGCTPDDECIDDLDCPLDGAVCIACICIGGSEGCASYGEGELAECVDGGLEACMHDQAECLGDDLVDPQRSVCIMPCTDVCDCPPPPAGFEDQLTCDAIIDPRDTHCYISCEAGQDCPIGWTCIGGFACLVG